MRLRTRLARVAAYFPERQIYVRSDGHVNFYTLSRGLQVSLATISVVFLAWVAFATVMVVFKDRIIAAEDHRFQRSQGAFESRLADLQLSYDELMAHAASAQEYADRELVTFSRRQNTMLQVARARHVGQATARRTNSVETQASSKALVAEIRTPLVRALHWLGYSESAPRPDIRHPSLEQILADANALARMSEDSNGIMAGIEANAVQQVAGEKALIAQTGINAEQFLHKLASIEGIGGPEVALDAVQLDGVPDRAFSDAYFKAEANMAEFADLQRAALRLPTAMPLEAKMERTSGFGPRLDPFTGRYAFHPGIDFAGATGSAVLATANGTVTFAGQDAGYGNMVEVDHGFGLKTRYAHLLQVAVTKGQRIAKGMTVGRLGSTGRSTGPHVHYEVWYDDKVRNPDGFLRLGKLAGNNSCMVIACPVLRR